MTLETTCFNFNCFNTFVIPSDVYWVNVSAPLFTLFVHMHVRIHTHTQFAFMHRKFHYCLFHIPWHPISLAATDSKCWSVVVAYVAKHYAFKKNIYPVLFFVIFFFVLFFGFSHEIYYLMWTIYVAVVLFFLRYFYSFLTFSFVDHQLRYKNEKWLQISWLIWNQFFFSFFFCCIFFIIPGITIQTYYMLTNYKCIEEKTTNITINSENVNLCNAYVF